MIINFKDLGNFNMRLISLGYSQRGFAKAVDISVPYMNQIINGNRNPSPKMAKKICDGIGCSFDEIFFVVRDNKSYQNKTIA